MHRITKWFNHSNSLLKPTMKLEENIHTAKLTDLSGFLKYRNAFYINPNHEVVQLLVAPDEIGGK